MSIPVSCMACKQAIAAEDNLAGKVISCPNCKKAIFVPSRLMAAEIAAEEVQVEIPVERPRKKHNPRKCQYCGFFDEDAGIACSRCLRKFGGGFPLTGCLLNLVVISLLAAAGFAGWRYWQLQTCRAELTAIAVKNWAREREAYEKGGRAQLDAIVQKKGWSSGPTRAWEVLEPEIDIPIFRLDIVGTVTLRRNIVEDTNKFMKEPRYTQFLIQEYSYDPREKKWRESGPPSERE